MSTPVTPPSGGKIVRTDGWTPVATVPVTPPSGGKIVRVGGPSASGWHIGSLRFGSTGPGW